MKVKNFKIEVGASDLEKGHKLVYDIRAKFGDAAIIKAVRKAVDWKHLVTSVKIVK